MVFREKALNVDYISIILDITCTNKSTNKCQDCQSVRTVSQSQQSSRKVHLANRSVCTWVYQGSAWDLGIQHGPTTAAAICTRWPLIGPRSTHVAGVLVHTGRCSSGGQWAEGRALPLILVLLAGVVVDVVVVVTVVGSHWRTGGGWEPGRLINGRSDFDSLLSTGPAPRSTGGSIDAVYQGGADVCPLTAKVNSLDSSCSSPPGRAPPALRGPLSGQIGALCHWQQPRTEGAAGGRGHRRVEGQYLGTGGAARPVYTNTSRPGDGP